MLPTRKSFVFGANVRKSESTRWRVSGGSRAHWKRQPSTWILRRRIERHEDSKSLEVFFLFFFSSFHSSFWYLTFFLFIVPRIPKSLLPIEFIHVFPDPLHLFLRISDVLNKFVSEILEMLASQCKHRGKSCSCKKPANLYHVSVEAKKIVVGFFFFLVQGRGKR